MKKKKIEEVIDKPEETTTGHICPVCGKTFDEETMFFVKGGCTCTWECFLKRDAENRAKRALKVEKN